MRIFGYQAKQRFTPKDLLGGLTVAFIVIPQGLAYAEIAGVPPVRGLYAAALPAIAAAPFASSRYLQTGPTAMTALLSFGAVTALATPGTDEYIGLSLLLAVVVGLARLGFGLIKGGTVTNFMSPPVILGFTTAAGVLILFSQIPTALGLANPPVGLAARLPDALARAGEWSGPAIGLSVAVALIVWGSRKLGPLVPGVLIAVAIGVLIGMNTSYPAPLVGAIPEGLPPISFNLPWSRLLDLAVPGIVIALVGFAEPTAIARTMATRDRERWHASRELVSQGLANLASGVSGGFPVGGSFARSAISRMAGARSRWAGAVTGLFVLAFMPFAGVLAKLPKAVLAAIVIMAIISLLDLPELLRLLKVSWGQSFVAWTTIVATLVLAPRVDLGVIVGVLVAAGVHVYREGNRIGVVAEYQEGLLKLRPIGVLFYGSAEALGRALSEQLALNPECRSLVIDLSRLGRIDYSGATMVRRFVEDAKAAGIDAAITRIPLHAEGLFARTDP
ncbi:MAG TPA: SulP family inorganic anion transporter [Actinobacteria bacterium]|nr:SulP family inorganic anion transporter [Actinomycetota bacterium]